MSDWILALVGAAALGAVALSITPEGRVKRAVKLVCGFAAVMALIGGVTEFDFGVYSRGLADYRREAESIIGEYSLESSNIEKEYIKERCEAYISDRAQALGITCSDVSVTVSWSPEGYWYPTEVHGSIDGEAEQLTQAVSAELGIAPEKQTWSVEHE